MIYQKANRSLIEKNLLSISSLARIIVAGLLFYALKRHRYDYYTLLRWVTSGVSLYSAIIAFKTEKIGWAVVLGILALFFNPLIPVHLRREVWAYIDVAAAVVLLASLFFVQEKSKEENS